QGQNSPTKTISVTGPGGLVSEVNSDINTGHNATLTQDGDTVTLQEANVNLKLQTTISDRADIQSLLKTNGVPVDKPIYQNHITVKYNPPSQLGNWITTIVGFLPLLIFGALLFF